MLRPYSAYLRVYEPLSAFNGQVDTATIAESALDSGEAERYEQAMWLRSQAGSTPTLLPAELTDGRPEPGTATDMLVREPEEIPGGADAGVGPEPLVCPLELRARSAAALVSFLGEAHPALRSVIVSGADGSVESVRARANAVLSERETSAMHVLSVNWSVPLPWFTLIDPAQRKLVLGSGMHDPERELSWRTAMADARRRVAEARELAERTLGDEGPTQVLIDTERWLTAFHPNSAVELDYGGLVQLIDDATLESDTSADDVHAIVAALRSGDIEQLTDLFQELREYWGALAARERYN
ncbi:hypothetical protein SAMN06265360_105204 [Haloechinothrix alba]|uniref:DUF8083 domain-containing protein n=1 Tax=Haloechinothrix alba TaxID=664784 RepID=A0A238W7N7_9PSEU|nr:hypothetical protein [Haloechinothrix alba]SNR42570.1 hypothetical protein SAMN06265360_105204 [Haloechinothrix alba]